MGRAKRLPKQCRNHLHVDLSLWDVLEREGLLDGLRRDLRWQSFSDKKEQRRLDRVVRLLKETHIAGYTPPRLKRRGKAEPDPWLYLTTRRGEIFRLRPGWALEQWKRAPSLPGCSTDGNGNLGWHPTTARANWLRELQHQLERAWYAASAAGDRAIESTETPAPPAQPADVTPAYTQLPLF
jgi:hypothetical protein